MSFGAQRFLDGALVPDKGQGYVDFFFIDEKEKSVVSAPFIQESFRFKGSASLGKYQDLAEDALAKLRDAEVYRWLLDSEGQFYDGDLHIAYRLPNTQIRISPHSEKSIKFYAPGVVLKSRPFANESSSEFTDLQIRDLAIKLFYTEVSDSEFLEPHNYEIEYWEAQ